VHIRSEFQEGIDVDAFRLKRWWDGDAKEYSIVQLPEGKGGPLGAKDL
jgi:hypothetical protein